jgi:hypothetical protein
MRWRFMRGLERGFVRSASLGVSADKGRALAGDVVIRTDIPQLSNGNFRMPDKRGIVARVCWV